ncbi:hypothetical protein [Nocardia sp. NPDC050710]|uniref:hypothetical protein n=1 Tax=Nocardia sp. NPDC050710 TaxID=3157220 RepID=UPI0033C8D763
MTSDHFDSGHTWENTAADHIRATGSRAEVARRIALEALVADRQELELEVRSTVGPSGHNDRSAPTEALRISRDL